MTYSSWYQAHGKKHNSIIARLTHLSQNEIIEYFRFENMVLQEPDFCPLYADAQKCHDIEILNCYLCACPYFVFDDDGISKEGDRTTYSLCSIESKYSTQYISQTATHLDCSACLIPHNEQYIKSNFSRDWFEMMSRDKSS